ncbi:MAG: hypothetical protein TEF_03730 [Rhizobiales bacterium NRL2]|nr:MAG: hypothetical protein TEF_03730 [Rhizobiales bacterium NRL2]
MEAAPQDAGLKAPHHGNGTAETLEDADDHYRPLQDSGRVIGGFPKIATLCGSTPSHASTRSPVPAKATHQSVLGHGLMLRNQMAHSS